MNEKKYILVETSLQGEVEYYLPGKSELLEMVAHQDLKNHHPSWLWEYPSGKMYKLKNYDEGDPVFEAARELELNEIDWDSMFEKVGEDKDKVASAYEKLSQEDTQE